MPPGKTLLNKAMQLTPEDKLILASVKIHPTNEELETLNSLIPQIQNWDYLAQNIVDRGIGPLFFRKLPQLSNQELVPADVRTKLQQAYYRTLSRGMVLYEAFRKIAEAFNAKDIQVIALKGIYLAENLYKDIALRQFSDIDLLVKEEDGLKCLVILQELGYTSHESNVSDFGGALSEIIHYPAMVCNDVSVEIHIKLHRKTERYNLALADLWNNALPIVIHKSPVYTFAFNDLLIYLCIHLDKHFRVGHIQFTCFNDITNLLDSNSESIDWHYFIESCEKYNCTDVVFKYLILCNINFNAPLPPAIMTTYSSLLTEEDQSLFEKYLVGYTGARNNITSHIINLNQLNTFSARFSYFAEALFPPKSFMIEKYNIQHPSLFLFYYPYRYYIGLKGFVYILRNRKSKE
ncbi:MAG: nucleotidyltransferase family protein [Paludibacter sp.]|nr:nucleotidyltransferase family protein [Paludibacter sp.]